LDRCKIAYPKLPRITKRANFLKDFEAVAKRRTVKAYVRFCLDEEDSLKMKLIIVLKTKDAVKYSPI